MSVISDGDTITVLSHHQPQKIRLANSTEAPGYPTTL